MIKELLIVCTGSFVGGGLRYLVSRAMALVWTPSFFGTLTANVAGCFLIGILSGLSATGSLSPSQRLLLVTGLCGGFTTFSTFINENVLLTRDGNLPTALIYTSLSLLLGVIAVVIGYKAAMLLKG